MSAVRSRRRLMAVLLLGLAAHARAATNSVIAAYFIQWGIYDRNYHVTNIPADLVTHIHYAFARPAFYSATTGAALESMDSWADYEKPYPGDDGDPFKGSFNQLLKLKRRFPHVQTLISAGGWTDSDDFSDIVAYSNARAAFVESCLTFITNYGFDGIDFDWEYPVEGGEAGLTHRPEDRTNFLALVREMRDRLDVQGAADGRRYLVTIAASADYASLTTRFAVAEMSACLDWINLMTYDFAGPWDAATGHDSPLYGNPAAPNPSYNIHTSVQTCLSNGVPAGRIVIGIPFYGRGFKDVPTNDAGLFQSHGGDSDEGSWEAGTFDYKDLRDGTRTNAFINQAGFVRHWDDTSKVPWLFHPTSHVFITYEDEVSVGLKARYALAQSLGGVMFWSQDADTDDAQLQRAIYRVFYPTRLRPAGGLELSWQAWTGRCYAVDFVPDLDGAWGACATLVDTSGAPVTVVTGVSGRITLADTGTAAFARGFYKIKASSTNEFP